MKATDSGPSPTASPTTAAIFISDSEITSEIGEVAELLESLERFRKSVLGYLHGMRLDKLCIGGLEPTLDAGQLVCAPQILSRDFKLIRAALRALDLDVSHEILSGVRRTERTRDGLSGELFNQLQQSSELLASVVAGVKK